ncbi:MAG TPA: response regulator transcription factor [Dehalococcoidia bacterium]|nr:response regulator transcription factor [Dehalococcoidia bacterium]
MSIRVLLVDDESLVRAGFRLILDSEEDIEVVGEAGTGAEAVALTKTLDPDVVLMDIQMPVMNGLDATREIMALGRTGTSRVIILTTFELDEYVYEALRAGASGFLLKRAPAADLVAGIRIVAAGEALLAPSVTRRLINQFAAQPGPAGGEDAARLSALTEREREVLGLMAHGLSNAEIAEQLVLTEGTVKTHVKHVFEKLGLRDRTQAVILAYDVGLVRPKSH